MASIHFHTHMFQVCVWFVSHVWTSLSLWLNVEKSQHQHHSQLQLFVTVKYFLYRCVIKTSFLTASRCFHHFFLDMELVNYCACAAECGMLRLTISGEWFTSAESICETQTLFLSILFQYPPRKNGVEWS